MSGICLFLFVAEIWGVMFLVWGAFHEDRLIAFEKRVSALVKKVVRK